MLDIRNQLPAVLLAAIDSNIWSRENSIREGEMSESQRQTISVAVPHADVNCLCLYEVDRIEAETTGVNDLDDDFFQGTSSDVFSPGSIEMQDYLIIADFGYDCPISLNVNDGSIVYFVFKDMKAYWVKSPMDISQFVNLVSGLAADRQTWTISAGFRVKKLIHSTPSWAEIWSTASWNFSKVWLELTT